MLAFITIALQSAKKISAFLDGVKDGPDNIARAVVAVTMLQSTLAQLARCRVITEDASSAIIQAQIRSCSEDLTSFTSKLSKLQIVDTQGVGSKTWRRLRTVFNEKELDRMTVAVGTHSSNLGLWLLSSQRYRRIPHGI